MVAGFLLYARFGNSKRIAFHRFGTYLGTPSYSLSCETNGPRSGEFRCEQALHARQRQCNRRGRDPDLANEEDICPEREHGIELTALWLAERTITGHIDFLQVQRCVHVLDYKPDARTNRPIAQLAIYALALTRRVPGLRLFDIKCAWFNEQEYCEMFPRTLFATQARSRKDLANETAHQIPVWS